MNMYVNFRPIHLSIAIMYQSLQMDIADIPPHDMTGDFVVLSERRKAEENVSKQLQVKILQYYKVCSSNIIL